MATGSLEYDIDAFVKKQKAIGRPDEEVKSFLEKNFNPQVAQLHFGRNVEGTTEKPELSALQQVPVEAVALAGAGAGKSIYSGFKSLSDRMAEPKVETPKIEPLMDVNQRPPTGRIEPEFNKPGSSVVKTPKDPIEQKLLELYEAQQAAKTQQPPKMGEPGFQPSAPVAPPSVKSLDEAFAASIAPTKEAPKSDVEGSKVPPGMREQYKKSDKKNPIGPGAFNHLANNLGLEKAVQVWEEVYGKKNVPYKQFVEDYSKAAGKEMMGPKQPLPPGAKPGGSFGTPQYIPEYIKGGGTLGPIAGLAGLAGLTALTSSPEARAAMGRAQSAIQDLGISPDIFAGKGEEMGRLGKGYVTAGNPQYKAQIAEQLKVEKDPERRQLLLEEFQKAGGSGAGRGVAPPSEYMR